MWKVFSIEFSNKTLRELSLRKKDSFYRVLEAKRNDPFLGAGQNSPTGPPPQELGEVSAYFHDHGAHETLAAIKCSDFQKVFGKAKILSLGTT